MGRLYSYLGECVRMNVESYGGASVQLLTQSADSPCTHARTHACRPALSKSGDLIMHHGVSAVEIPLSNRESAREY